MCEWTCTRDSNLIITVDMYWDQVKKKLDEYSQNKRVNLLRVWGDNNQSDDLSKLVNKQLLKLFSILFRNIAQNLLSIDDFKYCPYYFDYKSILQMKNSFAPLVQKMLNDWNIFQKMKRTRQVWSKLKRTLDPMCYNAKLVQRYVPKWS